MKRVRESWRRASVFLTASGSVESSTVRSGKPILDPKVRFITSGARLDPPMPSSRMFEKPRRRISVANDFRSAAYSRISVGEVSHPSRFLIEACTSLNADHHLLTRRSERTAESFFQLYGGPMKRRLIHLMLLAILIGSILAPPTLAQRYRGRDREAARICNRTYRDAVRAARGLPYHQRRIRLNEARREHADCLRRARR